MPLYDYKCAEHGLFHQLVEVADAGKPAPAPPAGRCAPG